MSFIIGKKCVSTCDTACVFACPVDCIHGPIDVDDVDNLREQGKLEGVQLFIDPDTCIDCGACVPECPVDAIYESEEEAIEYEGDDESVKKNYEFFDLEWEG